MTEYKKILAATDMHFDDLPVVNRAVAIASQNNAELTVVTVLADVPYYMASGLTAISDIEEELDKASRDQLMSMKEKVDYNADYKLLHGTPKWEIINYAKENNIDLIVMGSHGRHGVQRLLGSTATAVLHRAKCDVMVVRIKD